MFAVMVDGGSLSLLAETFDNGQIYRNLRVQSDYTGTMTYRIPVPAYEVAYIRDVMEESIMPFGEINADPDFPNTRIRHSGLPHEDSIVIILFGDGFTASQYGTWPTPASGTVLYHANNAIDAMLATHPFGLFEHLVTAYVIHAHGVYPNQAVHPGRSGYVGSIVDLASAFGGTTVSGTGTAVHGRLSRIHALANQVVAPANQTMIQIISNAGDGTGWAWLAEDYLQGTFWWGVTVGVTSIRHSQPTPGGNVFPVWPLGSAWHGTFIHEFGHSFGRLADEHDDKVSRGDLIANSTLASHADADVKWAHWFGHRNVELSPIRFTTGVAAGYASPAFVSPFIGQSGCFMRASWGNRNFCGVCTAELVRRMAHISGETFIGRSPNMANPLPITPTIAISAGVTRILDSAFNGNTSLQTITIPSSVNTIGDFAFIGATGLNTIIYNTTAPAQINDTTFAGLNQGNITLYIPSGSLAAFLAAGWTGFKIIEMTAPGFTTHPEDCTVVTGQAATFAVATTGNPTPALQ